MNARVAIIDDNESMRRVLSTLLTQSGYQVVATLPDGSGVIDCLQRQKPDVVCLDYHLPGKDGLTLLAAIHTMAPQVDVVFMTANGDVSLERRAADAGAAGFLRKPFGQNQILAELQAVREARLRAGTCNSAGHASRTAVVADDSSAVRLVLKGLLEESGITVVQTVANGAEALQALRRHRPDLLCLDVNMPVMGGIEALPLAREISPRTMVIMVTGCDDRDLVGQAAGLGAKGYILKPLRPAYVEGLVRNLFGTPEAKGRDHAD